MPWLTPAALSAPAAIPVPGAVSACRQPQCSLPARATALFKRRSRREAEQTWTCSLACEFLPRPFPPCRVFRLIPSAREVPWVTGGRALPCPLPPLHVHHLDTSVPPSHAVDANQPWLCGAGGGGWKL